ncbi:hypothetical protein HS088_TW12G00267 [Tripterygium wilfordii]|uniref:VQ domain-containing protein n=1 Tax=Tripterygium wilfordii TaxID=458696 RepID=A0A7J7CYN3_TRIWF|nr:VQ motif-containing protein 11 [Tripterygium wilfordii]KAF5739069.1 hypothetical protein HS088_TW12G00267 [Tripterygium wilfordii]
MASSSNYDSSHNTTFVQADPSNFRTIVQKLTGAPEDPSTQKLPLTHPTRDLAPKRSAFKLNERRQSAKNLEIQLNKTSYYYNNNETTRQQPNSGFYKQQRGSFLVSPVSTLDFIGARVSPRSPNTIDEEEEQQRVVAERGFYLHPSPLSTPRSREPELLTLFPLHSPRDNGDDDYDCSSSPS